MLDKIASKIVHKDKNVVNRRERSITLSEVKSVKNISKNLQSLVEISPEQREVLFSDKLQDHAYG